MELLFSYSNIPHVVRSLRFCDRVLTSIPFLADDVCTAYHRTSLPTVLFAVSGGWALSHVLPSRRLLLGSYTRPPERKIYNTL